MNTPRTDKWAFYAVPSTSGSAEPVVRIDDVRQLERELERELAEAKSVINHHRANADIISSELAAAKALLAKYVMSTSDSKGIPMHQMKDVGYFLSTKAEAVESAIQGKVNEGGCKEDANSDMVGINDARQLERELAEEKEKRKNLRSYYEKETNKTTKFCNILREFGWNSVDNSKDAFTFLRELLTNLKRDFPNQDHNPSETDGSHTIPHPTENVPEKKLLSHEVILILAHSDLTDLQSQKYQSLIASLLQQDNKKNPQHQENDVSSS